MGWGIFKGSSHFCLFLAIFGDQVPKKVSLFWTDLGWLDALVVWVKNGLDLTCPSRKWFSLSGPRAPKMAKNGQAGRKRCCINYTTVEGVRSTLLFLADLSIFGNFSWVNLFRTIHYAVVPPSLRFGTREDLQPFEEFAQILTTDRGRLETVFKGHLFWPVVKIDFGWQNLPSFLGVGRPPDGVWWFCSKMIQKWWVLVVSFFKNGHFLKMGY